MPTAFETFVNTELPLRTSIAALPNADEIPRFTGDGRALAARTPAEFLSDISGVSTSRTITVAGVVNQIVSSAGAQDLSANRTWTIGLADNPIIPGTGAMRVPDGTTAQRPSGGNGDIRYNTSSHQFEIYADGVWYTLAREYAKEFYLESPTASDDLPLFWWPENYTITECWGVTDAGTVTFQLNHRPRTAPFSAGTDVFTSAMVADTNGESKTSGDFTDATVDGDRVVFYDSSAVASSPTKLLILVKFTVDKA